MGTQVMTPILHPKAGDWVQPTMRGLRHICCDCGATHRINFRITNDDRVQMQFFTDNKATRKHRTIAKVESMAREVLRRRKR